MALSRAASTHTYSSSSGGQTYLFDVIVDGQGVASVRNIRGPNGLIQDARTQIPQSVIDDMDSALESVSLLTQETEVDAGNIVFELDTTVPVVIPGGVLNNTNYRVVFTTPDGTVLVAENKTTTGFDAVAATAYGAVGAPVTVGYSVLVKTGQASDLSGVLTIADVDGGSKAIVFSSPLPTTNYRVVLEPRGLFDAHVPEATKLKTGFTVELGHVPEAGGSVDVGYDVFV